MKKFLLAILCGIFFLCSTYPQHLQINYNFDYPEIIIDDQGFVELVFHGALNYNKAGNPLIPHFGCEVLLPQGMQIEKINILGAQYSKEIKNIIIKPSAYFYPISTPIPEKETIPMNAEVYLSEGPYPEKIIQGVTTQYLCGHSIGLFTICPILYFPEEQKVLLLDEILLDIVLKQASNATEVSKNLRSSSHVIQRLADFIDNPGLLSQYPYNGKRDINTNDILLITKNDYKALFAGYMNFKMQRGYRVKSMSVENIEAQYPGEDLQEKIRNCIKQQYQAHGTTYVILAGDSDPLNAAHNILPHRGMYVSCGNYCDYDIPSDMYYACLDGTWNDNDNNKWGEVGEYDVYAEVYIGRICFDSPDEIYHVVQKLEMYQDNPVLTDIENALFLGENLDGYTFGGDFKDEILFGSNAHGFTTVGIPGNFNTCLLYDREIDWNKQNVFNQFNNIGINLLNHVGHAHITSNMKIPNSQVTISNFLNNGIDRGFVIGYSQGCYSGSFDNRDPNHTYLGNDCFAENITTIATGEVAMIANSRYGFYSSNNTNNASQYLDRQFFDAIFGEGKTGIGWANSDSKEDNASYMNTWGFLRWTVYGLNLFGDPSMDIWTGQPEEILATYPMYVPVGISEINIQTDAPGARIGLVQNNALIGRGIADVNGHLLLPLFEPLTAMDDIDISIIAHNRLRHAGEIFVTEAGPFVAYYDHQFNDLNGNCNGQIDYGEQILLSLYMKNIGSEVAHDVDVNLVVSDWNQVISLMDANEHFGDFDPQQVTLRNNGFSFQVSDDVADQHRFKFIIKAEGDTLWNSFLSCKVNAPVLALGKVSLNDILFGNGNGILEPGEKATLIIEAENQGHSETMETFMSITTSNPYVTLLIDQANVGIIQPNSFSQGMFELEIDDWIPVTGAFASFDCLISSGSYACQASFMLKLGLVIEDFESGDFLTFDWLHEGDSWWSVTDLNPYEGDFAASAGPIGHLQSSSLIIDVNVLEEDSISFYYKTATQEGSDFLSFYVDTNLIRRWSGNKSWKRFVLPVTSGNHVFKWEYKKDSLITGNQDRVWLDYISLPASEDYFVHLPELEHPDTDPPFVVYPNPFKGQLWIEPTSKYPVDGRLEIFDMTGEKIRDLEMGHGLNKTGYHLIWKGDKNNLEKAPPGIYYLRLTSDNQVCLVKVMRL